MLKAEPQDAVGGGLVANLDADHITAETIVDEVVTRFPASARVFIRRRMHCVGCEVARFETVAGACRIYRQPLDAVLAELRRAAQPGSGAATG
ncbi:MAG: DUF1858 domain-containing protein [Chloroflexi bacterium]|nr:DUF1858 domain-containing protein [Chloroflexota bacterium]